MRKCVLLVLSVIVSSVLFAQTDLFFSEYVEGSGNNKAVEIYNPTNKTIDLSKYYVARYSNGSTTYTSGGITQLSGTIGPYKTHVLVNGQTTSTETSPACDSALQAKANQLDIAYPAPTYMNGNDAIALLKAETGELSKAVPVDLIGQIGMGSKISAEEGWAPFTDTVITYVISEVTYKHTIKDHVIRSTDDSKAASYGPYWLAWTQDHTLRRKPTVVDGVKANPVPFNVKLQWDTVSVAAEGINTTTNETYLFRKYKDIWDDLGKHRCVADPNYGNSKTATALTRVNIYPTVVKYQYFIVESDQIIHQILIYTSQGTLAKKVRMPNNTRTRVSTNDLARGIYLVKTIGQKGENHQTRIIVE